MKALRLDESPVPGKPLGRHVLHDPHNRDFPALEAIYALVSSGVAFGNPPPKKRGMRAWYRRSVWDQNTPGVWNGWTAESSCTIQGTAGALVTNPFTKFVDIRDRGLIYSPRWRYEAYRLAQRLDPWSGEEPVYYGSSGLAACKALVSLGVVPPGWKYRWAFGGDEMLEALEFGPLSVGTYWPEGFDHPDQYGRVKPTGEDRGGHQYEVIDYEEAEDLVICLNSWGRGYARNGRFAVDRREFFGLLERDGDVNIWVPI